MLATNSVEMFPAETAQSMFDFRAEEVVGRIAPRPLLLIHAANDSVTPTEQSIEMFKRAGQPAELHLFSGARPFSVQREFVAGLERDAQLARRLFPGRRMNKVVVGAGESLAASSATRSSRKERERGDATIVADGLVWANLRGVDGHGVSRLPSYLKMIERGEHRRQGAAAAIAGPRRDVRARRRSRFRSCRDDAGGRDRRRAGANRRCLFRPGARHHPHRRYRPLCAMDGATRLRRDDHGGGSGLRRLSRRARRQPGNESDRDRGAERRSADRARHGDQHDLQRHDHAGPRRRRGIAAERRADGTRRAHHRSGQGRNSAAARRRQGLGSRPDVRDAGERARGRADPGAGARPRKTPDVSTRTSRYSPSTSRRSGRLRISPTMPMRSRRS